jgi:hypothetical protein
MADARLGFYFVGHSKQSDGLDASGVVETEADKMETAEA